MMEHHEVIKISGRITTNGLKMIYKVIYIGKSDHEAINPYDLDFVSETKCRKKAENICLAISLWLFQSRGIMSDFIFFVLCTWNLGTKKYTHRVNATLRFKFLTEREKRAMEWDYLCLNSHRFLDYHLQ